MSEPKRAQTFAPAISPQRSTTGMTILFLFTSAVVLALAVGWRFYTRTQVDSAIAKAERADLQRVQAVFEMIRVRSQDKLKAQCSVLAEDPRLKATLATEGMDEATVADILGDLRKLQGGGLLLILTSDGRVFAQAGANELRGLDLSGSSVVQKAKTEAAAGSWVIGREIMDLAAIPIRSDSIVIAYLVVGQPVDQELVSAVARATGVDLAIGLGTEISLASTTSAEMRALFNSVANHVNRAAARVVHVGEQSYVTAFVDLEQAQTRPYLVVARSLEPTRSEFEALEWLWWIPAGLVLLALVAARIKQGRVQSRHGGV